MHRGGLGIEHLENVEPIGPDADGNLFAATDLKLDRKVAVRVLPPVASADDGTRFIGRARALARLSRHPNIVTVFDAGLTPDERPYLITELVDGPDLATRLTVGGPLPWPEATDVTLQLAAGLEQVHQAGGRHRELRPENVVFAGSAARLTDVGLVPAPAPPESTTTLTHRAPEAFDGDGDERSDLYSLTSLLYLMIDGRAPFWRPSDTAETLRARVRSQAAPPLDPDLVPPALAVFVTAGLSADPLDRPQHIGEFASELRLIAEGRTTGSTPSILHQVSGSVPTVPPALAVATMDTEVATDRSVELGPSVTIATAELVVPDGRPLAPAGSWAPPGSTDATAWAGSLTEPAAGIAAATTFADIEPPPPAVGAPAPGPGFEPPVDELGHEVPAVEDPTTLIPVYDDRVEPTIGPDRRPLLVAAGAMIAVGLFGLLAVIAIGLGGSDAGDDAAAPVLADPNAPTEAGTGEPSDALPTTLTPLAMLPESTTTTASDELVTSTDTTIRRVVVPDLVNLEVAVAGQRLSDAGFEVLVVGRVSPGSVPGTVIQQTPAAGSTIELPATVTLFIPRSATLPSMVGRPADTVCLQLTALGLRCEQTLRFDDRVAPGAVIATVPTEGSAFTDGQTIRVEVSRGPLIEVRVPPVTGLTENEARAALTNAGFAALTTVNRPSNDVPAGRAIGTDPAAGTSLAVDQPVAIQISSGPALTVTVPQLLGLDRAEAEAALQRARLTASFVTRDLPAGDPGIGRVVAVDPATNQVLAGSTVTVTIGQARAGDTTTTTPSTTTSTTAAEGG